MNDTCKTTYSLIYAYVKITIDRDFQSEENLTQTKLLMEQLPRRKPKELLLF